MSAILIVDDDKSLRDLLSRVLQEQGHDVATAGEGNEALDLMAHTRFEMVISDIIMPGKEGMETIREIRGYRSSPCRPVVRWAMCRSWNMPG